MSRADLKPWAYECEEVGGFIGTAINESGSPVWVDPCGSRETFEAAREAAQNWLDDLSAQNESVEPLSPPVEPLTLWRRAVDG